jgi:hypothetical protein
MRRSTSVRVLAAAAAGAVLLSGAAASAGVSYLTYEGWDAIQVGRGGEKKVVDGVDLWVDGAPPRRFKIIGTVEDDHRHGLVSLTSPEREIVRRARAAGGDALVAADDRVGTSRYLVVKYLADLPTAPSSGAADRAPPLPPAPAYAPPPKPIYTSRY